MGRNGVVRDLVQSITRPMDAAMASSVDFGSTTGVTSHRSKYSVGGFACLQKSSATGFEPPCVGFEAVPTRSATSDEFQLLSRSTLDRHDAKHTWRNAIDLREWHAFVFSLAPSAASKGVREQVKARALRDSLVTSTSNTL